MCSPFAKDEAKADWRYACSLTYLQTPLSCRHKDAQHFALRPPHQRQWWRQAKPWLGYSGASFFAKAPRKTDKLVYIFQSMLHAQTQTCPFPNSTYLFRCMSSFNNGSRAHAANKDVRRVATESHKVREHVAKSWRFPEAGTFTNCRMYKLKGHQNRGMYH